MRTQNMTTSIGRMTIPPPWYRSCSRLCMFGQLHSEQQLRAVICRCAQVAAQVRSGVTRIARCLVWWDASR